LTAQESILHKKEAISHLNKTYAQDLQKLKDELYGIAIGFDTYAELYSFVKSASTSVEEFSSIMFDVRPIFLDRDKNVILF